MGLWITSWLVANKDKPPPKFLLAQPSHDVIHKPIQYIYII